MFNETEFQTSINVPHPDPLPSIHADHIILLALLPIFDLFVIAGNSLVIIAVWTNLRSVTNIFVVSLAAADLLFVGLTVLPLSISKQILNYWPFGATVCTAWLACDVWLCTASILNLCAISLDRFLAIRFPMRYLSLMTPFRAKLLVLTVWVIAFLVCSPPPILNLLQENQLISTKNISDDSGAIWKNETFAWVSGVGDQRSCRMHFEPGYIIYSAFLSFWIPMFVMVFFYWKIYITARRATRSLELGVLWQTTVSSTSARGSLILIRIHRGKMRRQPSIPPPLLRCSVVNRSQTPKDLGETTSSMPRTHSEFGSNCTNLAESSSNAGSNKCVPNDHLKDIPQHRRKSRSTSDLRSSFEERNPRQEISCKANHSLTDLKTTTADGNLSYPTQLPSLSNMKLNSDRLGFLRHFNKEKKASKTIGVIVGCFVLCWAPFFTVYLTRAYCYRCISDDVFTVFFWIGYINSAMNPLIYARYSRDFRHAFQKLLKGHGCK